MQTLKDLSAKHPVRSDIEINFTLHKLDRMAKFYGTKSLDAPEQQQGMFKSFVQALNYATEITAKYDQLTVELRRLTEKEQS